LQLKISIRWLLWRTHASNGRQFATHLMRETITKGIVRTTRLRNMGRTRSNKLFGNTDPIQHVLILELVRNVLFCIQWATSAVTVTGMNARSHLVKENESREIVVCMPVRQITTIGYIHEKSGQCQEINSCLW